jgi:hypothetical protein
LLFSSSKFRKGKMKSNFLIRYFYQKVMLSKTKNGSKYFITSLYKMFIALKIPLFFYVTHKFWKYWLNSFNFILGSVVRGRERERERVVVVVNCNKVGIGRYNKRITMIESEWVFLLEETNLYIIYVIRMKLPK